MVVGAQGSRRGEDPVVCGVNVENVRGGLPLVPGQVVSVGDAALVLRALVDLNLDHIGAAAILFNHWLGAAVVHVPRVERTAASCSVDGAESVDGILSFGGVSVLVSVTVGVVVVVVEITGSIAAPRHVLALDGLRGGSLPRRGQLHVVLRGSKGNGGENGGNEFHCILVLVGSWLTRLERCEGLVY